MSHITTVKTELKDVNVLKKALVKLGYRVKEGGVITGGYSGGRKNVEILATKDGFEIGFKRSKAKSNPFEILADWNGYAKKQEKTINDIFQTYSVEYVLKVSPLKGYSVVKNRKNENGQVEILLRKVA